LLKTAGTGEKCYISFHRPILVGLLVRPGTVPGWMAYIRIVKKHLLSGKAKHPFFIVIYCS
jgi:hypothetical protein